MKNATPWITVYNVWRGIEHYIVGELYWSSQGGGVTDFGVMSIPLALQSCSKAPLGRDVGLYLIKGRQPGITESSYADAGDTNAKTLLVLTVSSLSIIRVLFP